MAIKIYNSLARDAVFFLNLGICVSKTTSRAEYRIILQEQSYFRSRLRADLISRLGEKEGSEHILLPLLFISLLVYV